jgi:pimeloyl-ACP methyl ester carboxylesterase
VPVVVLHGFLEQGFAWDAVALRLGRRVIAPDHRGHGRSAHVGAGGFYHFWDYVADVDALVEHLGAPVDLIGHSMGGTIASLYAGVRPDRVRRLVLVEGLGPPDMSGHGIVERARQFLDARSSPPRHGALTGVQDGVSRMRRANPRLDPDVALRLAERVIRPLEGDETTTRPGTSGAYTWTWDPLHRARSPVPFQASLFVQFLECITAPVLLVDGADSPFQVPDRQQRQDRLRRAERVVLPSVGHMVHHDDPEALARVIVDHLDG